MFYRQRQPDSARKALMDDIVSHYFAADGAARYFRSCDQFLVKPL